MLIGWNASVDGRVGRRELERAKAILSRFDVIVIMEWLQRNDLQKQLLNIAVPLTSHPERMRMERLGAEDIPQSMRLTGTGTYPFQPYVFSQEHRTYNKKLLAKILKTKHIEGDATKRARLSSRLIGNEVT